MRDYGIVSPRFWIGHTGRKLREHPYAQRIAMYLLTAPTSEMTGVFYCPLASILNDVGSPCGAPLAPSESPCEAPCKGGASPFEAVRSAISLLQKLDFCVYDLESEFIFVKEMAKWQIAESMKATDNRVKCVKKLVESMPKGLREMFLQRYNDAFSLGYDVSLFKAPAQALRSQEQEQGQEHEHERARCSVAGPEAKKRDPLFAFPDELPDDWRENARKARPDIDPDYVFTKLKARYVGTATTKMMKTWRREYMNWIGREFAKTRPPVADAPYRPTESFDLGEDDFFKGDGHEDVQGM